MVSVDFLYETLFTEKKKKVKIKQTIK